MLVTTKYRRLFTFKKYDFVMSAIYFLDAKGKILISRHYRGDVNLNAIDKFIPLVNSKEEDSTITPIIHTLECSFLYVRYHNLYVVFTAKNNVNIVLLFAFLYKIIDVMKEYFKELDEETIKDNFVLMYEILDEVLDFGYPQTTDYRILQEYITQKSFKSDFQRRVPMAVTNAVSWRPEGIKYKKNEVFLDVIESVNLLINARGHILRNEVIGSIKMKVYLSGMPELYLGLNDRLFVNHSGVGGTRSIVDLEDVKFHQCVQLSKYERYKTVSFIPPDGDFELMSYRLNTNVKPLIRVESISEHYAHSRVEYFIKAKSQFKERSTASSVEILIPVPCDASSPKFTVLIGNAKYVPEQNAVLWSIKSLPGEREYVMRAHFNLPSVESEEIQGKEPIRVKFEIPFYTISGLQLRYLRVIEKSGQITALPWVRYVTQSGDYQIRTN